MRDNQATIELAAFTARVLDGWSRWWDLEKEDGFYERTNSLTGNPQVVFIEIDNYGGAWSRSATITEAIERLVEEADGQE